jgi:hypothetical protein
MSDSINHQADEQSESPSTITWQPARAAGPLVPLTDPHSQLRDEVTQAMDRLDQLFDIVNDPSHGPALAALIRQEFFALRDQLGRVKIGLLAGITFV